MKDLELEAIDYKTLTPIKIIIKNGIIDNITSLETTNKTDLPFVGPGLIDLQVNGISGFDFNTTNIFPEDIVEMTSLEFEHGVTTYFPCLVTNSDDAINEEIKNINKACETYPWIEESIGGIHLEGPFISTNSEARGAHCADFVKPPDWNLLKEWQDTAKGKIKLITLSPEWENTESLIQECLKNNILVSIGHTAASPEQITKAVDAGAELSTHLGNGCQVSFSKSNNFFWEQLTEDRLWTTIIADGFHLSDQLLKVILKLKQDKLILISDSTKFLNFEPGRYHSIIGGDVILNDKGKLYLESNPELLAGSARPITHGINYLISHMGVQLSDAWNMASTKPSELTKINNLALKPGNNADLVLFSFTDNKISIQKTIKRGKVVYSAG